MIRVVNLFKATKEERAWCVYIGRYSREYNQLASPLGNPYKVAPDMTTEQAIRLYRLWLWRRIQERGSAYRELVRLAGLAQEGELLLACYCHPKPCHGDVVKSAIEWIIRQGKD
jgi:hypothetical protein